MVTLRPQDDGTFLMGDCGEWMYETIMGAYPLLEAIYERTDGEPGDEELAEAVREERKRLAGEDATGDQEDGL